MGAFAAVKPNSRKFVWKRKKRDHFKISIPMYISKFDKKVKIRTI